MAMNYSICSRKRIKADRVKLRHFGITAIMALNRKVDLISSMTSEELYRYYTEHDSDCAVHNEPALPNGPCNCSLPKRKANLS